MAKCYFLVPKVTTVINIKYGQKSLTDKPHPGPRTYGLFYKCSILYILSNHKYGFIAWMENSVDADLSLHCFQKGYRILKKQGKFDEFISPRRRII